MLNDINLIPDKILFRKNYLALFALKVIVGIVLLGLLISALFFKTYQKEIIESKIFKIDALLDAASVQKLKQADEAYNNKVNEKQDIEELYKNFPIEGLKSTRVLEDISAFLPPSVNITYYTFDLSAKKVSMNITGVNRPDIALFIKHLFEEEEYSVIVISEISLKNGLYWLSIDCNVNKK